MSILSWFMDRTTKDDNPATFVEDCRAAGMKDPAELLIYLKAARERERLRAAEQDTRAATYNASMAESADVRSKMMLRPSRTYPISLQFDGLEWTVRLSSGSNPRNDLIGRGAHPEAAMMDFDSKWFGVETP